MWNHFAIIRFIKSHIPFALKILLIRALVFVQSIFYYFFGKKIVTESNKRVFFLLSTDYSNLGDHAMSYASIRFLNDLFPDYEVIEITVNDTLKCLNDIKRIIGPEDIVCLKGGGNIGVEYFREELIRRKILKSLPDNMIVIFPQTVFFPNNKLGNHEFEKTIEIYNAHPNLLLFLRDKPSFDLISEKIATSLLVPDIVFSLGDSIRKGFEKKGVAVCLRDDVEGVFSEERKERMLKDLVSEYGEVEVFDTIKPYYIPNESRLDELQKLWKSIEQSTVLVTDRLHGMIFAYLLHTPCVLLKTYNHKLIGQYKWVSNSSSILLYEPELSPGVTITDCVGKVINTQDFGTDIFNDIFSDMKKVVRMANGKCASCDR